jgi:hypothetical protein
VSLLDLGLQAARNVSEEAIDIPLEACCQPFRPKKGHLVSGENRIPPG